MIGLKVFSERKQPYRLRHFKEKVKRVKQAQYAAELQENYSISMFLI